MSKFDYRKPSRRTDVALPGAVARDLVECCEKVGVCPACGHHVIDIPGEDGPYPEAEDHPCEMARRARYGDPDAIDWTIAMVEAFGLYPLRGRIVSLPQIVDWSKEHGRAH